MVSHLALLDADIFRVLRDGRRVGDRYALPVWPELVALFGYYRERPFAVARLRGFDGLLPVVALPSRPFAFLLAWPVASMRPFVFAFCTGPIADICRWNGLRLFSGFRTDVTTEPIASSVRMRTSGSGTGVSATSVSSTGVSA